MTCKKFKDLMYLRDDELDAADTAELNRHTSSCPACAAEYARAASARKAIRSLTDSPPQLSDSIILINSVIGRIELETMTEQSHQLASTFDRCVLWLSAPMVRAAAAAMLLLITGAFAFEYTSAYVTMKEFEGTFEPRSMHDGNVASTGALNGDKLLNAVAYLVKKISGKQSYVEVSDSWVMINKQSLEQLFLLYDELKENTPQLRADFRTANPGLSKLLDTKHQSARIHITLKEREQVIRELNNLFQKERRMP